MARLLLDHPAWFTTSDGRAHRVVGDTTGGMSLITGHQLPSGLFICQQPIGDRAAPAIDSYFDPGELVGPLALAAPLRALGPVTRMANPLLWDALGTAVLANFIARKNWAGLHRRLCRVVGRCVQTTVGSVWVFPTPQALLGIGDDRVADVALRVKTPALQLIAEAYLAHGAQWNTVMATGGNADTLVEAITVQVPQLDRATIARAVADHSNDFSVYPTDHLLRAAMCQLSTRRTWPVDDTEFRAEWHAVTGDQRSLWTVLTLASASDACLSTTSVGATTSES
ncbi:hypothetical protein [Nocardia sp. NPDC052566]|uniref:hypothetical protein n=1 Tax=Nocardia sp. NPDC052566 TaxID=3364330 RepID=UPI0037C8024D